MSLLQILSSAQGFDLAVSPLQKAICCVHDGLPLGDVLDDDACQAHFGCSVDDLAALGRARATKGAATGLATLFVVIAGVRSGKSLIGGGALLDRALHADLSRLKKHEIARGVIVAPTVDNASATFRLLLGHIQASPALSRRIEREPTADTITIVRDDGRRVEICVVAASRGAITLRSRWLVGFIFDEAALFAIESTGAVVNVEELLRAAEPRLVPGGRGWIITSPFGPSGLVYELWRTHFGKPGRIVVVHAPTAAMNPAFPIEQIEAVRARTPDVAAREFDATWLDPDVAYFNTALLHAATRAEPLELPPLRQYGYTGAWDAATRGNAWTFVVAHVDVAKRLVVDVARQWVGSKTKPLDPERVIAEIAELCARYRVRTIRVDGWSTDALAVTARKYGLTLREVSSALADKLARYETIKQLLETKTIELAPVPAVLQDLQGVRKIALSNGIRVELMKTPDGRHSDFAPSIALVSSIAPKIERAKAAWQFFATQDQLPEKREDMIHRIERQTAHGIAPNVRQKFDGLEPQFEPPENPLPPIGVRMTADGTVQLIAPTPTRRTVY